MARSIIILFGCALLVALVLLLSQSKKLLSSRTNESNELAISTTNYTHAAAGESGFFEDTSHSSRQQLLLLHRQKRYLLFPEGSSFQLVFDLIIPIIDYTNFAILGITCAVAWELPSKPPSELLENLRTRLNDGTLGTVRRNDSVQQETVAMAETSNIRSAINWQAMHAPPTSASAAAASTYASNVHNYPYYTANVRGGAGTSAYANSPNGQQHAGRPTNWHARQSIPKWRQWAADSTTRPLRGSADRWSDNWWQRNKDRVQQNWRRKQQQWSSYEQPTWSTYEQPMQRYLCRRQSKQTV